VLPTQAGSIFLNWNFSPSGKWEVLKKMRFLYKSSFFVIKKINPIDFKSKI